MNKSIKNAAQAGFTLIELIVVIVILGILAATALPKFANLGGDARFSTVQAAKGALNSTSAMVHARALTDPAATTLSFEGGVAVGIVNGYPAANTPATASALQTAAGLAEWTIIAPGTAATANSPVTTATQVAFVPASVAGTATGLTCFIRYTESTAVGVAPVLDGATNATSCE